MKLLSFGEILFDVFPDKACIGGAPLNLAAHFALQGGKAYILSAVGKDALGEKALNEVEDLLIDTEYVNVLSDKATGQCLVTLDENKIPSYNLLSDVAYDYIDVGDIKEKFDIFSFGTLSLRSAQNIKTVKKVIASGACVDIYTDLNIRAPHYSKDSVMLCLENATILKVSDEELPVVTEIAFNKKCDIDEAFKLFAESFEQLKVIIITAGANGAYAYDCKSKKKYYSPIVKTSVVSTVGAGDSFGATFLAQYFKGEDMQTCLDTASKVSAFVVSNTSAIPDNMKEFIAEQINT